MYLDGTVDRKSEIALETKKPAERTEIAWAAFLSLRQYFNTSDVHPSKSHTAHNQIPYHWMYFIVFRIVEQKVVVAVQPWTNMSKHNS